MVVGRSHGATWSRPGLMVVWNGFLADEQATILRLLCTLFCCKTWSHTRPTMFVLHHILKTGETCITGMLLMQLVPSWHWKVGSYPLHATTLEVCCATLYVDDMNPIDVWSASILKLHIISEEIYFCLHQIIWPQNMNSVNGCQYR